MTINETTLEQRLQVIENKLNEIQTAFSTVASRVLLKQYSASLQSSLTGLRNDLDQLEITGAGPALEAHKTADHHTQYHNDARGDARYFQQSIFISSTTGAADAGKPVKLDDNGLLDPSLVSLSFEDHGELSGLEDDDHLQYHTDTRGDARYAQLSHNHNDLYYTEGEVDTLLSGLSQDHGELTGLEDDDHIQYHTNDRGDIRYSQLNHTHTNFDNIVCSGLTTSADILVPDNAKIKWGDGGEFIKASNANKSISFYYNETGVAGYFASTGLYTYVPLLRTSLFKIDSNTAGNIILSTYTGGDFNLLQFGGTTAEYPALKRSGIILYVRKADDSGLASFGAGMIYSDSSVQAGVSGELRWNARSKISSPVDGDILFTNSTGSGFSLLQFGGTTSNYPALQRVCTGFKAMLADNSGVTTFESIVKATGLTTTERDELIVETGMIIFNTTVSGFQGYNGTTWQDLA